MTEERLGHASPADFSKALLGACQLSDARGLRELIPKSQAFAFCVDYDAAFRLACNRRDAACARLLAPLVKSEEVASALARVCLRGVLIKGAEPERSQTVEIALALIPYCDFKALRAERSALSWAAEANLHEVAEELIALSDIDQPCEEGRSALFHAAAAGADNAMLLLLSAGADARRADHAGQTALMARREGAPEATALLAQASDARARDKKGRSVLWWLAARGSVEAVEAVIKSADPATQKGLLSDLEEVLESKQQTVQMGASRAGALAELRARCGAGLEAGEIEGALSGRPESPAQGRGLRV